MALRLTSTPTEPEDKIQAWKENTTTALKAGTAPNEWFGNMHGIDPHEAKMSYASTFISDAYNIDLNTARSSADLVLQRTYGEKYDIDEVVSLMANQWAPKGNLPLSNIDVDRIRERGELTQQIATEQK